MSNELSSLLDSLAEAATSQNSLPEPSIPSLFDIKLLNGIEDKMCRGIAKKVYVKGKKENLSSLQILDDIILELEKNDKSPSDFNDIFESIRKELK